MIAQLIARQEGFGIPGAEDWHVGRTSSVNVWNGHEHIAMATSPENAQMIVDCFRDRDAQVAALISSGKPITMAEVLADLPAAGRKLLKRMERANLRVAELTSHCDIYAQDINNLINERDDSIVERDQLKNLVSELAAALRLGSECPAMLSHQLIERAEAATKDPAPC